MGEAKLLGTNEKNSTRQGGSYASRLLNQSIASSLQISIILTLLPSEHLLTFKHDETSRFFALNTVFLRPQPLHPVQAAPARTLNNKQSKRRKGRRSPPALLAVAKQRHRCQVVLGPPGSCRSNEGDAVCRTQVLLRQCQPGTQMTLVLNGKGLLLEGSNPKIEDKQFQEFEDDYTP